MSKLSTTPVLRCTHCGKVMKLTFLATTQADEDGSLLMDIFRGVADTALCSYCQNQYNYYVKEGRSAEWIQNRFLNVPSRR